MRSPSMLTRPRTVSGGPIVWILLALLLATVLAFQALDAARSHRRTSEAALRDYASFAIWELGRSLTSNATESLTSAMMRGRMAVELEGGSPEAALPHFAQAVRQGLSECGCPEAAHDFFALDLVRGTVSLAEGRLGEAHRDWLERQLLPRLRDSIAEVRYSRKVMPAAGGPGRTRIITEKLVGERVLSSSTEDGVLQERRVIAAPSTPFGVIPPPGQPGSAVMFSVVPDAQGNLSQAYGYVIDVPALAASMIAGIVARSPLLPPSLLDRATNEQVLSLSVHSSAGDTLFRSAGTLDGAGPATDTVAVVGQRLVIRAAVRPEMADRLVIGGLPRSRLPLLLGIFALTLGLLVVAIRQFGRQQELIRLRSDFISGVSHELRTPLAQIRLFSDLLDSGRLQETQRQRSIRIIGEEARRLTFLVENILQFSRSERRLGRISPQPADVALLTREIVDSFAPLARGRRVTLHTELQDDLVALVDADALRQVLLNLLDNAVKYGPPDQRVVVGAESAGRWVRIRIDDQGPGIPAAERERIWEPYRRLARDVESATGGSGIGLAVVRELVELHGGRVLATDAPGGGARFTVDLPRATGDGAAPATTSNEIRNDRASGVNG